MKHLERLAAALRPLRASSQVVHGDLTGNVLFAEGLVDGRLVEAERRLNVAGDPSPYPEDRRSAPYPQPAMPLSFNLQVLKKWAEQSGLKFSPLPLSRNIDQPFGGRGAGPNSRPARLLPRTPPRPSQSARHGRRGAGPAGASSAYLTVSEIFPMETRAMAIAFFYAIGTAAGGISGPLLFGNLIENAVNYTPDGGAVDINGEK